jgi:hypothetical protein
MRGLGQQGGDRLRALRECLRRLAVLGLKFL